MQKKKKKGDNGRVTRAKNSGGQIFQEVPIRTLNMDKQNQ